MTPLTISITLMSTAMSMMLATTSAQATCTRPQEAALPGAQISVTPAKGGKQRTYHTGPDGMLHLRHLRKGDWRVKLADTNAHTTMRVASDRRLTIMAATIRYSCSPPGGPVQHNVSRTLRQINQPATEKS